MTRASMPRTWRSGRASRAGSRAEMFQGTTKDSPARRVPGSLEPFEIGRGTFLTSPATLELFPMALILPDQSIQVLQRLIEIPDEKIGALIEGLKTAGPKFSIFDLSASAAKYCNLPRGLVEAVLQVISAMYIAKEQLSNSLDDFLDIQVRAAVRPAFAPAADRASAYQSDVKADARWAKLRAFIKAAMSLEQTVGTASKAGHVLTEHEKIFVDARVVTDIRPIFHFDVSEKPTSAVFVHMLRITARDMFGTRKAEYFALDGNDLRSMRHIIDRAIIKEQTLKATADQSGIQVIAPGEIF